MPAKRLRALLPSVLSAATLLLSSTLAQAADKVTFQLDWLPGGDKAPVYVGIAQGFFAEEDLEVTIQGGRGSTDAITKIATGTSDIGTADIGALLAAKAQEDVPVTAVYSLFADAPHVFVTLEGSGIEKLTDVAGKQIVTSPFTSSNVYLPLVLESNGLSMDDIQLTKADPGALGPMLITKRADVAISWITSTDAYRAQAEQAGMQLRILPWSEAGMTLYATSLVASDAFLSERPEVAKRFIKAFARSVEFARSNPVEAAKNINAMVPEVDVDVAAAAIENTMKLVYTDATATDGLGQFESKRLASTWSWVSKAQQLDLAALDVETAVDRSFIPQQ